MIEKKVEGQEIKAVAPSPRRTGPVVDIFAALKKAWKPPASRKAKPPIEASAKGRRRLQFIFQNRFPHSLQRYGLINSKVKALAIGLIR